MVLNWDIVSQNMLDAVIAYDGVIVGCAYLGRTIYDRAPISCLFTAMDEIWSGAFFTRTAMKTKDMSGHIWGVSQAVFTQFSAMTQLGLGIGCILVDGRNQTDSSHFRLPSWSSDSTNRGSHTTMSL